MRPLRRSEKQWLFQASALQHTPSREHGLSYEQELQKRARTIDFIRSLAARCGLTAEDDRQDRHGGRARGVLTTSATLVHRFYMRRSLKDFPPELMAPTILFIASKIEEEPLKLRHIVNHCLEKFEHATKDKLWEPVSEHPPQPSHEYRRWEHDILCAEEVTHETLCFDMTVEHPWAILQRGLAGIHQILPDRDIMPLERDDVNEEHVQAESSDQAQARNGLGGLGARKGAKRISEALVWAVSWTLLNELYPYPISVLYHPYITAFAVSIIVFKLVLPDEAKPLAELLELGPRFGLDALVAADGTTQMNEDVQQISGCVQQIYEFASIDLKVKDRPVLKQLWEWVHPPEFATFTPTATVEAQRSSDTATPAQDGPIAA